MKTEIKFLLPVAFAAVLGLAPAGCGGEGSSRDDRLGEDTTSDTDALDAGTAVNNDAGTTNTTTTDAGVITNPVEWCLDRDGDGAVDCAATACIMTALTPGAPYRIKTGAACDVDDIPVAPFTPDAGTPTTPDAGTPPVTTPDAGAPPAETFDAGTAPSTPDAGTPPVVTPPPTCPGNATVCTIDRSGDSKAETVCVSASLFLQGGVFQTAPAAPVGYTAFDWSVDASDLVTVVGGYYCVDFRSKVAGLSQFTFVSSLKADGVTSAVGATNGFVWMQNYEFCTSQTANARAFCNSEGGGNYLLAVQWDGAALSPAGSGAP